MLFVRKLLLSLWSSLMPNTKWLSAKIVTKHINSVNDILIVTNNFKITIYIFCSKESLLCWCLPLYPLGIILFPNLSTFSSLLLLSVCSLSLCVLGSLFFLFLSLFPHLLVALYCLYFWLSLFLPLCILLCLSIQASLCTTFCAFSLPSLWCCLPGSILKFRLLLSAIS